jgi:leucyl/phenylalanyl-tRNA--protein transferase
MHIYLPELGADCSVFPDVNTALEEPDGLLALGGDLSPERLIHAYRQGIFPWFETGQPLLWWSPSQRMVLTPGNLYISRSLRKSYRRAHFTLSINTAFNQVVSACAAPRHYTADTWISQGMQSAYQQLHDSGYAHSIEVWQDARLVGGLYGLYIGNIFCGESMFHRVTDASKIAFIGLQQHLLTIGCQLIDCQLHNSHLQSLGAVEISRNEFIQRLREAPQTQANKNEWQAQPLALNLSL